MIIVIIIMSFGKKTIRPYFQILEESILVCSAAVGLTSFVPVNISFVVVADVVFIPAKHTKGLFINISEKSVHALDVAEKSVFIREIPVSLNIPRRVLALGISVSNVVILVVPPKVLSTLLEKTMPQSDQDYL